MTTTGMRTWRFASESLLAAPVSWRAMRKSEAWRTPRARPFFIGMTVGRRFEAGRTCRQGFDLRPADGDDRVAVVHPVMGDGEPRRSEADDQHLAAAIRSGQRAIQVERVPARQETVDLEAPRQVKHVL